MVGVPKSNGCATCRKRKIKCDEKKPACSRCADARFTCPGYPARLKFQDEGLALQRRLDRGNQQHEPQAISRGRVCSRTRTMNHLESENNGNGQVLGIRAPLLSESDLLAQQFFSTFRLDLPQGKSLASFGPFIAEIPRRIGTNKACDLAVRCICREHKLLLTGGEQSIAVSRAQYGEALVELQRCLNNRAQAFSADTLCATILLTIYEMLVDTDETALIQHAGGATRLIELSGVERFKEPFAFALLRGFRSMMVFGAIFGRQPCFLGRPPWKRVFDNVKESSQSPFDTLFSLLPRLPNLLSSLRSLRANPNPLKDEGATLGREATSLRLDLKTWRGDQAYAALFHTVSSPSSMTIFPLKLVFSSNAAAAMLSTYSSMLIVLNCVILQLEGSSSLASPENLMLAEQLCQSVSYSEDYAPFGNCHMDFALRAAYLVVQDTQKKDWIVQTIAGMNGPSTDRPRMVKVVEELESYFDYLKL